MKRLVKKLDDHGRKLNRVQLKRNFNKLVNDYLELNNSRKALIREIDRLEAMHQEVLEDRDKTIERTKKFNNNLANKLQEKIGEVAERGNELDEITSKYILEREKNRYLKDQFEINQTSLRNKRNEISKLKGINAELEDEIKNLKTPWHKRGIFKCK